MYAATPFTTMPRIANAIMPSVTGISGAHKRGIASDNTHTEPTTSIRPLIMAPNKLNRL